MQCHQFYESELKQVFSNYHIYSMISISKELVYLIDAELFGDHRGVGKK